jgi:hypothetical protein
MGSLSKGPEDAQEVLKLQSDLINAPRIGTDDNFAFPAMQFNVASGQKEGRGECSVHMLHLLPTHDMLNQRRFPKERPRILWRGTYR